MNNANICREPEFPATPNCPEQISSADICCGHAGSEWLRMRVKDISPLGERVADILGWVYRGLYHLPARTIERTNWGNTRHIEVFLGYGFDIATIDGRELTELVILCHDLAIRLAISARAGNVRQLRLFFTQRQRGTDYMECHPTMDEAIEMFRRRSCQKQK